MKYLQGVITNDIYKEASKPGFYSAFLNAQGRVLNDVWIYKDGGEHSWLIEVDAKEVEVLAKHITRYRMRAKFEVNVEKDRDVWSFWGEERDLSIGEKGIVCPDNRVSMMGFRVILDGGSDALQKWELIPMKEGMLPEDVYRVRRYLLGVPEGQGEILRGTALPQESNLDVMGGIDYEKGCYVGQELTIRTHHMGVVRKRIVPMVLLEDGEHLPSLGIFDWKGGDLAQGLKGGESIKKVEKKGSAEEEWLSSLGNLGLDLGGEESIKKVGGKRSAGKWLSGVGNLGLGLARLDQMGWWIMGKSKRKKDDDDDDDDPDEFVVEGKGEKKGEVKKIRVMAFPPAWVET